ncbi:hypothetical protein [Formosa sp. Hel1_33_131]|jgi:hypothetical protein|uniref:hypothetical protein n=1 Tax=Formosa sp. Hel1_33_131 TaxID=1336794 RepID=UPI00084E1B9A|nr:hypothetical protein [Formosa sp. Hel1_33_131]
MLTSFLKSISYILHPLLMPWMGAVYFFTVTPLQYHPIKISFWLLSIILWSLVVPLVLYFILKKLNTVQSIDLKTSKERIWPLLLNSIILGYLSFGVLPEPICVELHYLFLGAMMTAISGMVLALLKFKTSIHMMSTGGAFFFMVLVNLHYGYSFSNAFALFIIVMGAMASSRLHLNAHTVKELVAGLVIGVVPQLLLLNHWL